MMAIRKAQRFVPQAAQMGEILLDSPKLRKTVDENIIPALRKIARTTPPPAPLRLNEIPNGAARKTMARQIAG